MTAASDRAQPATSGAMSLPRNPQRPWLGSSPHNTCSGSITQTSRDNPPEKRPTGTHPHCSTLAHPANSPSSRCVCPGMPGIVSGRFRQACLRDCYLRKRAGYIKGCVCPFSPGLLPYTHSPNDPAGPHPVVPGRPVQNQPVGQSTADHLSQGAGNASKLSAYRTIATAMTVEKPK